MRRITTKCNTPTGMQRVLRIMSLSLVCLFFGVNLANASQASKKNNADGKEVAATQQSSGITVTGKVVDSTGEPLPGVTVIVKGVDGKRKITGIDGDFSIEVPYAEASLSFSYIGFKPEEVALAGRKAITVTLIEDVKALEEVVVVAYTTQKKATITGAVATITTKDLTQSPTANLNNALAGRLPGLLANQFAGGEPGVDKADIYVRGFSTYGSKSPIIIVDGVERDMSYYAPEEIETLTILKDASATAPYGIRGANGVIVITTKRGRAQEKASVNFKASVGVNQLIHTPEYLGSADYGVLYNEAQLNDAKRNGSTVNPSTLFTQESIDKFRIAAGDNSDGNGYNWDYYDYIYKPSIQQDYSISIRGGNNRARYYVMAGFFQQNGNYDHTDMAQYNTNAVFNRYNFRSNIDVDITDKFYARLDLGARITSRNAPGTSASRLITLANNQAPYLPITLEENDTPSNQQYYAKNPLGMLFGDQINRFNVLGELSRKGYHNDRNTYFDGNFTMGYDLDFITKGLKVEGTFSYDEYMGQWIKREVGDYDEGYRKYPNYATFMPTGGTDVFKTPGHYTGAYKTGNKYDSDLAPGQNFDYKEPTQRVYYQFKLFYDRNFGKHGVSAMALANRSEKHIKDQLPYRYQGITSRIAYNYDNRYLFDVNVAYNGSENFAPGNRYGFFPAFSAGWVLSEEKFMESTRSWLNNLKIRGSYGLVGNDNVGIRFPYMQFFGGGNDYSAGSTADFSTGQGGGTREGSLSNPNLTWEKAEKFNIGFDMALLNNRLTITADFFKEHRYDIFTDLGGSDKIGFPAVVGKSAPRINSGIVDNKGVDLELGWSSKIGKDIKYWIKPNMTFARNKIVFQNEIPYANAYRASTGHRINENFVYLFDHFVKDQAEADALNGMNNGAGYQPWGKVIPGDAVYKDLNNDGKVDDLGDRTAWGNPRDPEIQFGIPVGVQYKDFDFSVMFQGSANSSWIGRDGAMYDFYNYDTDKTGKVKPLHLERWTPETASTATYPALHYVDYTNNKNANSSLFMYDAKYIRMKTIEVGYSLPRNIIRYAGLQQVRLYVQGLNLATWDGLDRVDVDPETKQGGGDSTPIDKVVNFGIDITF